MPDVMTTYSENDRASQRFTYRQNNIVFGLDFGLGKKKKVTK